MFQWFKEKRSAESERMLEVMRPGSIAVLSASCCAPNMAARDEVMLERVRAACGRAGIGVERIRIETVTEAQRAIPEIVGRLDARQLSLVESLTRLFMSEGLKVFPMLIIDGELAFYGGVPEVSQIEDKIRHLEGVRVCS